MISFLLFLREAGYYLDTVFESRQALIYIFMGLRARENVTGIGWGFRGLTPPGLFVAVATVFKDMVFHIMAEMPCVYYHFRPHLMTRVICGLFVATMVHGHMPEIVDLY